MSSHLCVSRLTAHWSQTGEGWQKNAIKFKKWRARPRLLAVRGCSKCWFCGGFWRQPKHDALCVDTPLMKKVVKLQMLCFHVPDWSWSWWICPSWCRWPSSSIYEYYAHIYRSTSGLCHLKADVIPDQTGSVMRSSVKCSLIPESRDYHYSCSSDTQEKKRVTVHSFLQWCRGWTTWLSPSWLSE